VPKNNRKLKGAMGKSFSMDDIPHSDARPGAWKSMLKSPTTSEETINKGNHVPALIQDKIVDEVANGATDAQLKSKYELRDGYVRDVLVRRFGSIEGMKKALKAQCFENAMVLNAYAMENLRMIAPGQALMGSKIMVDAGLALEKSAIDRPSTIDFEALAALGQVLEKVEKRLTVEVTEIPTPIPVPASAQGNQDA
jgi:hypothetical protein